MDRHVCQCTFIQITIGNCPNVWRRCINLSGIMSFLAFITKETLFFISYVKNQAFPQPLSPKDEAKYIQLMQEGDHHARNTLIEHNLRLVAHIVKKFDNTGEDTEDLISIGTIGLIKGVESFKEGRGTKLATYAARCIENEILMSIRQCVKMHVKMYGLRSVQHQSLQLPQ